MSERKEYVMPRTGSVVVPKGRDSRETTRHDLPIGKGRPEPKAPRC